MTTMRTTSTQFPWLEIENSSASSDFNVRLVGEADNPSGRRIFWGKSYEGHPALLIEYGTEHWEPIAIPLFEHLVVYDYKHTSTLAIILRSNSMEDFFYRVALDIVHSIQGLSKDAIRAAAILRLQRWSAFLKPTRARLSREEQKGLIAELMFLQRFAFEVYSQGEALAHWAGPDAGRRDFEFGQTFVEVKSKRDSASPAILISSEMQLNKNESERLFLYVVELSESMEDNPKAFTVSDLVREIKMCLVSPFDIAMFEKKLANVGYFDEDDYSADRWTEGETSIFEVRGEFPRITSENCPAGIMKVKYQIDLSCCQDYLANEDSLLGAMG